MRHYAIRTNCHMFPDMHSRQYNCVVVYLTIFSYNDFFNLYHLLFNWQSHVSIRMMYICYCNISSNCRVLPYDNGIRTGEM